MILKVMILNCDSKFRIRIMIKILRGLNNNDSNKDIAVDINFIMRR